MNIGRLLRIRRSRKYPIRRDSRGRSLRKRCFELFQEGGPPGEIAEELGISRQTIYKYHQQWKLRGPDFDRQYKFVRSFIGARNSPNREQGLELFARAVGIGKEELESLLSKPYGLQRLLTGRLYLPGHAAADRKLHAVLRAALSIDDSLAENGGNAEDLLFAFDRLVKTSRKQRQAEGAAIESENKDTAITRQVLVALAEAERQGRPKRDRLTDEERAAILRHAGEAKLKRGMKALEISYLLRLGGLMAEGLTHEQARERIYRDLLDKGDVRGAEMVRRYQDKIDPVKNDVQTLPATPAPPPWSE